MRETKLQGLCFRSVDYSHTNFNKADATNADFRHANVTNATWDGATLTRVVGLDDVVLQSHHTELDNSDIALTQYEA